MTPRKITVVTGASTGIGFAIALRQARAGDRVWALVRSSESSQDLHDIASQEGLALEVRAADVTHEVSVATALDEVFQECGRVDRLVCNAGMFMGSTLESTTMEEFAQVFEVNYFGALRVIRHVLPSMRERQQGMIVATSSQSSQFVLPTWAAYSGSKRALETSLEALALEIGLLGIRVALVQPGSTKTAMREKIIPRHNHEAYAPALKRYHAIVMADREDSMNPDEVAQAVEEILITDNPPWRTRVGADANRNTALRLRAGDDEWLRLFRIRDDAELSRQWSQLRQAVKDSERSR